IAEYVEPKPGIQPSARHLEELQARLAKGDIKVIVTRPFNEHRSTDLLAEKGGVTILTLPLDVGGDAAATDYFKLFALVTDNPAPALGASCALRSKSCSCRLSPASS